MTNSNISASAASAASAALAIIIIGVIFLIIWVGYLVWHIVCLNAIKKNTEKQNEILSNQKDILKDIYREIKDSKKQP